MYHVRSKSRIPFFSVSTCGIGAPRLDAFCERDSIDHINHTFG